MQNIIRTEITDANCVNASPEISLHRELVRIIVANELVQNEMLIRDKDFMHLFDDYLQQIGRPTYGKIEDRVSELERILCNKNEEIENCEARIDYMKSRR